MDYFGRIAVVLLLALYSLSIHAQNIIIDSLRAGLINPTAIERASINYLIANQFFSSSPDSAMYYYNTAHRLARELNNDTLTAQCLFKIGILNRNSGAYEKAIENLYAALRTFERYNDRTRAMRCLQCLGMTYTDQGMYDQAIDYCQRSLKICEETGDTSAAAVNLANIGSIYYARRNYDKALEYFQRSLYYMEQIRDQQGIADGLNNIAVIYEQKKDLSKALPYHLRSLELAKEIGDSRGIAASYHNIALVYHAMKKFPVAIRYFDSSIVVAKEGNDKFYLKECYESLSGLYADMGNFQMAYQTHLLFSNLSDTLMSQENKKQFAEMNTKYETEKKDHQIGLLEKDKDIREGKIQKELFIRNTFVGGFAIMVLFAAVFFGQRNRIKKSKQRSDELLLNILPSETAEELKATGHAKAKNFEQVTVLFTDFKNFTALSSQLSAAELVNEIDYYYSAFDKIITRYNIEKIKTIGDSYMCAGGLPVPNKTNAEDAVRAAIEIRDLILSEKEKREAEGRHYFEIRIGCNTGPVVAGIVGIKKFAYDIWGDTVNIASRMESSGESGKVNISDSTYDIVKDKFTCTYRGKIEAKNKGAVDMYFVEDAVG